MTGPAVPYVSADQMREVDRLAVDVYGITLLQMMENAGRALARFARARFLGAEARGKRVVVLAGPGGNGGGGLVCARNLHDWGAGVRVMLTAPAAQLGDAARHQLRILERSGVQTDVATTDTRLPAADLVVDALIGYSLRGAPSGSAAALVRAANDHAAPTLALDVPTGVDSTSGEVRGDAVRAAATLTLALPKEGLRAASADYVGELHLADIGIPPELYAEPSLGLDVGPVFATDDIVRLK